uniref:Uncharacterized protein n=1 Tax=Drosophila-associated filamentous virus TaxID=2743186 RepID=A0A6M9U015_9VIRU|nr:putative protein 53 [Drosophila-associated filamentous virus]
MVQEYLNPSTHKACTQKTGFINRIVHTFYIVAPKTRHGKNCHSSAPMTSSRVFEVAKSESKKTQGMASYTTACDDVTGPWYKNISSHLLNLENLKFGLLESCKK